MEQLFHAQFYKAESEVALTDLANLRQLPGEWAETFLQRFKVARGRCYVSLPEREFVRIAQVCLNIDLKRKLQDHEFWDLPQLITSVVRYE